MIKKNYILKLFVIGTLFFIFCFTLFNFIKCKQNETYFNIWFYFIQEKNDMGQLLQFKDPEYGYLLENDKKYEMKNVILELKDIRIKIKYLRNDKKLSIYVDDFYDTKSNSNIFYSNVPNELLRKICEDIIKILNQNLLVPFGKKDIDITKDFINDIEFVFIESKSTIYSNMIINYKRDNKNKIFYFSYYNTINFDECIIDCKNSNDKKEISN